MKRLIWLPIAGFLLIAGATVAMAAPSLLESAKGVIAAADPAASPNPAAGPATYGPHDRLADGLLASVLSDLVTKGTITQAQSDAITQALQDKVTQQQADMEARRALIEGFVADGVITREEIDQLPADDPLRVAFDSIAKDGQITLDQLRGLAPFGGPGMGHDGGPMMHGRGPGMWWGPDDGANPGDPAASPNP